MVTASFLIVLPWGALLLGVLLQLVAAPFLPARGKGWLAFASGLAALVGVVFVWPTILNDQSIDARLLSWDGPAALAYHVDGLSLLFALMAAGIGSVVLLYSIDYMKGEPAATRFYVLMLVFIAGLIHLVFCADLFLLYVSWEIIGLCSFLLVGFWYRQDEAVTGARKVLVMTHIAGYGLLITVILLYLRTGSTLWTDPQVTAAFGTGLFLLTILAALAKSVQFPLHTWIPDAMAAPTPVSSLLHAACYVKAGVYLVARLHSFGTWSPAWETIVVWIGTVTLLVGGLFALIQSDLKRLLAFSTVSQIGYMVMGLGLGTPLGIAAGLLHCLNHGLFKGGLFLCAGSVQQATGTRDMDRMGGLARKMPRTTAFWLVMAGSVAGMPLLSGFVSKWLLYNAALEAGQVIPAVVSWLISVVTVFYFLKATTGIFFGEEEASTAKRRDPARAMQLGMGIFAAGSLLLGTAPQIAVRYLINPLLPALGSRPVIGVSWLGLTAGLGSWFATGGLILALVATAAGGVIYLVMVPSRRMSLVPTADVGSGSAIFTGGEPLAGPARLPASDFSLIVRQGLEPFYRWADPDRYYLVLWRALLRLGERLGEVSAWLERRAIPATLVMAAALAGVIGIWAPVTSTEVRGGVHNFGWMLPTAVGVALICLLLAVSSFPRSGLVLTLMSAAGVLALSGLVTESTVGRVFLMEGAALLALVLVWRMPNGRSAARVYLLTVLLSAFAMISVALLLDRAPANLVLALLMVGICLKLAIFPLYLWLPLVAEAIPAPVIGLVVAVVDVAAFGELLSLRSAAPWLFTPPAPWIALALISALAGAGLMLAQRDLKRLLAFSTIEDMGYLLFTATLGGNLGLSASLFGAVVHALGKALLFASLSQVEFDGELRPGARALAVRYPVSGAGFLLGALAILGVPPTLGFIARWRVYVVAAQATPWFFGALLLASALALLAYTRALAVSWWGTGDGDQEGRPLESEPLREPLPLMISLVCLGLILLLTGLWPRWLGA